MFDQVKLPLLWPLPDSLVTLPWIPAGPAGAAGADGAEGAEGGTGTACPAPRSGAGAAGGAGGPGGGGGGTPGSATSGGTGATGAPGGGAVGGTGGANQSTGAGGAGGADGAGGAGGGGGGGGAGHWIEDTNVSSSWLTAANATPVISTSAVAPASHTGPRPACAAGVCRSRRRTRCSSVPPLAASTSWTGAPRCSSRSASARAYATGSPHRLTARSSQQFSRSSRMRPESHHTAGW